MENTAEGAISVFTTEELSAVKHKVKERKPPDPDKILSYAIQEVLDNMSQYIRGVNEWSIK